MTGTSQTGGLASPSAAKGGCACGRVHPRPQLRRARKGPEVDLGSKVYEAVLAERAVNDGNRWWLHLSGDCQSPLIVGANDLKNTFAKRYVRCRRCGACMRARTNYWGFAGMQQTALSRAMGRRTWFGTLTLTPDWQSEFLDRARMSSPDPNAAWWDEPHCDERFRLVRDVLLKEVQRYWARLRKKHKLKYLVVFERHKSGLPHMHFLLHEQDSRVLKRELASAWPFGFSDAKLVKDGDRASWYVVKYLSKSPQARQLASRGYRPEKRPKA